MSFDFIVSFVDSRWLMISIAVGEKPGGGGGDVVSDCVYSFSF